MNPQPEEGKASVNDVLAGNKLIAEFMGWTNIGNRFEMSWTYYDDNGDEHEANRSIKESEFNYHSNWSQLMPVVENISEKGFCYKITDGGCKIWKPNYEPNFEIDLTAPTTKEAVYEAVVKFITWYNNQNQQS